MITLAHVAFEWIQAFTCRYEAGLAKQGRSYQQSEFNLTRHAPAGDKLFYAAQAMADHHENR